MSMLRIGVVRGGIGSEYYISLKTGESVSRCLSKNGFIVRDTLIARDGQWYIDGVPSTPEKFSRSVDIAFNALHGEFGEDGKIQKIFDVFGIPYTGSGVFSSAIGMNKELSKQKFVSAGINVPRWVVVSAGSEADKAIDTIKKTISAPYVVKPVSGGSSVGVSLARNDGDLIRAIEAALAYEGKALVEEYVRGREITVGVIDSEKMETPYVLPPLQIFLPEETFFNYRAKYGAEPSSIEQAYLSRKDYAEIKEAVLRAHNNIGARHYARYDFILSENGLYLLEVNTLPALSEGTLFPLALSARGLSFSDFIPYIISLALQKK